MSKKVSFGVKPGAMGIDTTKPDDRVNHYDLEAMKRLTIDVPASLHARLKSQCAIRGVKMADVVRELLENIFHKYDYQKDRFITNQNREIFSYAWIKFKENNVGLMLDAKGN